jgi:hypothetical protein
MHSVEAMVQMYFSNLQATPGIWENYVQNVKRLMKDSWEAETST